ncbi:uncharacterized protein LOC125000171 [Mugil cephalus]|uniref:uncharacterized protein LOC125000171 n=1 Tax=Mugil cephalus TaxID=48193 RepID=UPI001FB58F18|nr:uncharacterized protein LOC125000171 [Mugil cephalus]XP_047431523.1 uncharacterized protein LOC125000171 [Mugil cephalus]
MEVLVLLLTFFTVLHPKPTLTQTHFEPDADVRPRDVSISAATRGNDENTAAESTEMMETDEKEEEEEEERIVPETDPAWNPVKNEKAAEERRGEEGPKSQMDAERQTIMAEIEITKDVYTQEMLDMDQENLKESEVSPTVSQEDTDIEDGKNIKSASTGIQGEGKRDDADVKLEKSAQMKKKLKPEIEEEESKLVAGLNLYETHGKKVEGIKNANHKDSAEREKEDQIVVNNLTPPLSTSSAHERKELEIPATIQIITQTQNPPLRDHNVPPPLPLTPTHVPPVSSHPPGLYAEVWLSSPSVNLPTSISHMSDSTVSPGHHQMVKNMLLRPAREELQTVEDAGEINTVDQPEQGDFIATVLAAMPKPEEANITLIDLIAKDPNPAPRSKQNTSTARNPHTARPAGKPGPVKRTENGTKVAARQNKSSPPQTRVTEPQVATAKAPSARPTKTNKSAKNRTMKKSGEKKRKKDNKTQKPPEKTKTAPTTYFPYFMDDYCPPECACYGRVVQCSDKDVDNVPYGIPYNARYILLMNNHIGSIQLDLLNEYVSLEFLVLSNNRLTDGAVEGAFEGVPALKRLYLDRNLLESVPADLPFTLEELRLDNNRLKVMSEAAWAQCPGLLVLSLSNNSLGNESESLPNAVLAPLRNLRTLNLDHNQLTSVPLGLPLSIRELYLKGNLIEQFRQGVFSGTSGLVVLDLSANKLTNGGLLRDSLLNTTHLESLNLEGNRLKQIPRHLPPSLKTLNLEGNLISSVKKAAFSTLKNLEHLGLARNKIFKVATGAFRTLPVLHQLDLCHNTLLHVPRQLPPGLHSVSLTYNKIQSVPRDAFCWGDKTLSLSRLVRVQLEHNLIDMGKLDTRAFRCLRGFQVVHFY